MEDWRIKWNSCMTVAPKKSGEYIVACVLINDSGHASFTNIAYINYSVKAAEKFGGCAYGWNCYDNRDYNERSDYADDHAYKFVNFKHYWAEIPEISIRDEEEEG